MNVKLKWKIKKFEKFYNRQGNEYASLECKFKGKTKVKLKITECKDESGKINKSYHYNTIKEQKLKKYIMII